MVNNKVNSFLYVYKIHCDYFNNCVKINFNDTGPNRLCQFNKFIKRRPRMLLFINFEKKEKFGEACSCHYEPFKTPVYAPIPKKSC